MDQDPDPGFYLNADLDLGFWILDPDPMFLFARKYKEIEILKNLEFFALFSFFINNN